MLQPFVAGDGSTEGMAGCRGKNQPTGRALKRNCPPRRSYFGTSVAMGAIQQTLRKAARTTVPILIQGEGGTGKEMLARWIHKHSACADGEFVKISCAAIPTELLESELFGYEKGAFTGANQEKPGRVEWADKGTLFLDDISELELRLQGKLLHFLQDGVFCRIGETTERRVDTRVICASGKDLQKRINSGEFRGDLCYRINVLQLRLPRLCERREDIPRLAEYFRMQHERELKKRCEPFRSEVLEYYKTLNWQGNLRELSNEVARYVLIGPDSLAPHAATRQNRLTRVPSGEMALSLKRISKEAVRKMERSVILRALNENKWNRRKTAEALQISYRSLIYKIREAGLSNHSETL
jgi:two-component system, NtrC family, response regulator AtoC